MSLVANALVFPIEFFIPVIASELLSVGPILGGILGSAASIGSMVGALTLATTRNIRYHGRLFVAGTLPDIPQIEPPFLDIAPAGMLPTIISHSKGVKCVLIRSNSSFHGPTTVLPSVKSPNRLSTTKSLPWESLLPCTTR